MLVSPNESAEERAAALLESERHMDRTRLRDLLLASLFCMASLAAGLFLVGVAVHSTDVGWGTIAFWSGLLVGNCGVLGAAYWLFVRAQARGDRL